MSTFDEIRAGLKAAVVAASGLPSVAVCWERSQNSVADPLIRLSLVSDVEVDPIRVDYDTIEGSDDLQRTVSQQRDFVFQVTVESVNDFHAASAAALLYSTRMALWSSAARAAIVGELIQEFTGVRPMHYRVDGRLIHAWAFDVQVRGSISFIDPTNEGTIDTVVIPQTLDDGSGTPLTLGDITVTRPVTP